MSEPENDYCLVFDHFYTNNHIQILKSLLPFIKPSSTSMLPVMIKYMELQYTISLTQAHKQPALQPLTACSQEPVTLEQIYNSVKKYLSPTEEKGFQQIVNMMHTMESVKEMQQMMELFGQLAPESSDGTNTSQDPFSAFSNMDLEGMMNGNSNMADMLELLKHMSDTPS